MISALALTGCQTADLSKQKSKTINMPTVMVSLDSDGDGVPDELDQCPNTKMKGNVVVDDRGCHLI
ncbi:MAG: OmpA family protein, partial [Psychrobacter sp.]|nr:OmpA family protein [Psychrobacter sp.]